jgi:hypothetical protein
MSSDLRADSTSRYSGEATLAEVGASDEWHPLQIRSSLCCPDSAPRGGTGPRKMLCSPTHAFIMTSPSEVMAGRSCCNALAVPSA